MHGQNHIKQWPLLQHRAQNNVTTTHRAHCLYTVATVKAPCTEQWQHETYFPGSLKGKTDISIYTKQLNACQSVAWQDSYGKLSDADPKALTNELAITVMNFELQNPHLNLPRPILNTLP